MELSAERIENYRESGYLVAKGLLDPAGVESVRTDALRLCRGEYPCEGLSPVPPGTPEETALGRVLCIHQPHRVSPFMRRVVAHPGIARVLARIVAPNVKCMQSMLFVKPPRFPGQAWHQDEVYIPTRDRSLTGAWIALDDASPENGCLCVIPGSHRDGYLYPQRDHGKPAEFDFAQESYGFDEAGEIPVPCAAGDVVFFHGYLLHRSRRNRSDRYRRALVNHYMNACSLLPWQTREGDRVATADYRDIVMVAGVDPYAWKGTENRGGAHVRPFDPGALES